ncbi:MAG: PqqD family peptide modification chaperone [Cyanophyceae cyanobacterium]
MSPFLEKYFCTRDVGVTIWQYLRNPVSVGTLCENLLNEFDVTRSACEFEVFEFLNELHKEGLIHIE